MANEKNDELNGSELGTLSYWDDTYALEINNFKETGDVGEIWFGEDSLLRIVQWILNNAIKKDDYIIDIGCGNGMTLIELAREGYTNLFGIDYSKTAIELALNICKNEFPNIIYKVCDITTDDMSEYAQQFKVVHDKGTYDAISLYPDNPKVKRESYIKQIVQMVHNDGYFIITSCNWTDSELQKHFKEYFKVIKIIPTPQFKFGGKVGNVITSMVFQKI